jgi:hypothetical protein
MTMVDAGVITGAMTLAVRAPSLHNSQPWRWVADGGVLELFADPTRIGRSTDSTGREVLISWCGARSFLRGDGRGRLGALIDRFPNQQPRSPGNADFRRMEFVTDAHRARAEAILPAKRIGFLRSATAGTRLNPCFRQSTKHCRPRSISDDSRPWPTSRLTGKCGATTRLITLNFFRFVAGYSASALLSEPEAQRADVVGTRQAGTERRACERATIEDSRAVDL